MSLRGFFIIFFALSCINFAASISEHPIILIVSYDGFRYDYIDSKGVNPVLDSIRHEGTYAEYMDNVFTTKTFPNHHSIATGLYPEVHGVLGNSLYDPKYGKELKPEYEFWHYNEDILPIWIANEKKGGGRYSGVMMWPGSNYNYSATYPTYRKDFVWNYNWNLRVDEIIDWITDPEKPANLVMLYFEQPDSQGHAYGPNAPEFIDMLKEMDKITKYLWDKLRAAGLSDVVNVFFVSDHGMESVETRNNIDLSKFVSVDKFDRYETSPIFMIYPKKGEANTVYKALKNASDSGHHFKVYKKEDIPERWHYKNNRRAPPILAVADPPYIFHEGQDFIKNEDKDCNLTIVPDTIRGYHGYDNTVMNMKPFFIAAGPKIKKNYKLKSFENVDLFTLWAHMLGFPELAANTNGSFDRVSSMLNKGSPYIRTRNVCGIIFGIIITGSSSALSYFIIKNKLMLQKKMYNPSAQEESLESKQRLLYNVDTEDEA